LIHSNELTKLLKPQNYSGTIVIDGKYIPVKDVTGKVVGLVPKSKKRQGKTKKGLVLIPLMDYWTHDIPVFVVALSENKIDIEEGFRELESIGYDLKVVVCDEAMANIAKIAKKVFPNVIIQICLKHYSGNIDRAFKVQSAKRRIDKLEKQLQRIGNSIFAPTHRFDIERARKLTNEIAKIEFEYGYLIQVQAIFREIFWGAETIDDLNLLEDQLNEAIGRMNLKTYPYAQVIKDRYLDYYEKREIIAASILHPDLDIPKTTNLIEGFNSTTIEIRLASIRGFEKEGNADAYINAIILNYRFHKFTDCKGKFKHLNRKSPLEIVDCKHTFNYNFLSRGEDWIKFCQMLKTLEC